MEHTTAGICGEHTAQTVAPTICLLHGVGRLRVAREVRTMASRLEKGDTLGREKGSIEAVSPDGKRGIFYTPACTY